MSTKVECPLCKQTIDLNGFRKCIECGEYVCYGCYNPKEKKCAKCEKAENFLF